MKLRLWLPDGPLMTNTEFGGVPEWIFVNARDLSADTLNKYFDMCGAEGFNWSIWLPAEVDE